MRKINDLPWLFQVDWGPASPSHDASSLSPRPARDPSSAVSSSSLPSPENTKQTRLKLRLQALLRLSGSLSSRIVSARSIRNPFSISLLMTRFLSFLLGSRITYNTRQFSPLVQFYLIDIIYENWELNETNSWMNNIFHVYNQRLYNDSRNWNGN